MDDLLTASREVVRYYEKRLIIPQGRLGEVSCVRESLERLQRAVDAEDSKRKSKRKEQENDERLL